MGPARVASWIIGGSTFCIRVFCYCKIVTHYKGLTGTNSVRLNNGKTLVKSLLISPADSLMFSQTFYLSLFAHSILAKIRFLDLLHAHEVLSIGLCPKSTKFVRYPDSFHSVRPQIRSAECQSPLLNLSRKNEKLTVPNPYLLR